MVASCVTERLTDPVAAPTAAVIAAVPFLMAVTSPAGEIVTTFGSEVLHVTTASRKIRSFWSCTSADRVAVAPIASRVIPDGEMTIVEASGVFPVMRSQPREAYRNKEEPPVHRRRRWAMLMAASLRRLPSTRAALGRFRPVRVGSSNP